MAVKVQKSQTQRITYCRQNSFNLNSTLKSAELAICKICKLLISMKHLLLFNSSVVTDELDIDLLNSTINSNRTFFMREANTLYV